MASVRFRFRIFALAVVVVALSSGGSCNGSFKPLGSSCTDSTECYQAAEGWAECNNGICRCLDGYFTDQVGICVPTSGSLDDDCTQDYHCVANLVCNANSVCDCPLDEVEIQGLCYGTDYNDECNPSVNSCTYPNAMCDSMTRLCGCKPGLQYISTALPPGCYGSNFFEPCTSTDDRCNDVLNGGDPDGVCTDGTCQCGTLTLVNNMCVLGDIGDPCTDNPSTCTAENAVCLLGVCSCDINYIYDEGICKAILGANCFSVEGVDNCYDPNSSCDILPEEDQYCSPVCTCNAGFVPDSVAICNATCIEQKHITETCDPSIRNHCADVGSTCLTFNSTTSKCLCDCGWTFTDGACVRNNAGPGDPCGCETTCEPTLSTYCNAATGVCECKEGYMYVVSDNGTICVPYEIHVYERCVSAVSCAGYPNAKCEFPDIIPPGAKKMKVCQCDVDKGYTYNEAYDYCECTIPDSICTN